MTTRQSYKKFFALSLLLAGLWQLSFAQPSKLQEADSLYQRYRKTNNLEALRQAAGILDQAQQSDPNGYDSLWRRARVYYNLGDDAKPTAEKIRCFEQAIQSATHATEVRPDGVEGHYWLGVSEGGYGEVKGKFKALSEIGSIKKEMHAVININPAYENGGAYLVLGKMDFELPGILGGSNHRAIDEYLSGLKVAPNNSLMKVYLAESYIDAGRKDEAKSLLDQVLAAGNADSNPELKDAQQEARKTYSKNFSK
jgi:hypothetical protein